jgi:hypothetical protein
MADNFDRKMKDVGWEISGGGCGHDHATSHFSRPIGVRSIPVEQQRWVRLVSGVWTSLSTSFLTDYYAPLIVGAIPLLVAAIQFALSFRH